MTSTTKVTRIWVINGASHLWLHVGAAPLDVRGEAAHNQPDLEGPEVGWDLGVDHL